MLVSSCPLSWTWLSGSWKVICGGGWGVGGLQDTVNSKLKYNSGEHTSRKTKNLHFVGTDLIECCLWDSCQRLIPDRRAHRAAPIKPKLSRSFTTQFRAGSHKCLVQSCAVDVYEPAHTALLTPLTTDLWCRWTRDLIKVGSQCLTYMWGRVWTGGKDVWNMDACFDVETRLGARGLL